MDELINQGIALPSRYLQKVVYLQQSCLRLPHRKQMYRHAYCSVYRNQTKSSGFSISRQIKWYIVLFDLSFPSLCN